MSVHEHKHRPSRPLKVGVITVSDSRTEATDASGVRNPEEAVNLAFEGRPGPVHIHVPEDLTHRGVEVDNYRDIRLDVAPVLPDPDRVEEIAAVLADALSEHLTRYNRDHGEAITKGQLPERPSWWRAVFPAAAKARRLGAGAGPRESDPRATIELLPDWERNWGLPDPCYTAPQTIGQRQLALVMRMTMQGAQSRAFFINVAAQIGYPVVVRPSHRMRVASFSGVEFATNGAEPLLRHMQV